MKYWELRPDGRIVLLMPYRGVPALSVGAVLPSRVSLPPCNVPLWVGEGVEFKSDIKLEGGVFISEYALIGHSVRIGADAHIGAGVYIGNDVEIGSYATIGANSEIHQNAKVLCGATLGANCKIQYGAWVGASTRLGGSVEIGEYLRLGYALNIPEGSTLSLSNTVQLYSVGKLGYGVVMWYDDVIHINESCKDTSYTLQDWMDSINPIEDGVASKVELYNSLAVYLRGLKETL